MNGLMLMHSQAGTTKTKVMIDALAHYLGCADDVPLIRRVIQMEERAKNKAKADLKKLQEHYQLKDEDIALLFKEAEQLEDVKLRPQPAPPHDLSSDRNIDYTKLQDFLKAGQWKEADDETLAVMLKVTDREKEGWLDVEDIENFPCTDLRTIDQLWVKYSNGHFGFSVQKQIYLEVRGLPDGKYYEEAWKKFGDRVGWRVKESWINIDEQVTFNTTAPHGHLPVLTGYYYMFQLGVESDDCLDFFDDIIYFSFFFSRVENCKL
ncbi:hypothetical protein WA1_19340 [Scytonema hofmannii PCC 7110]|uniref:GUN4-like domain-containing protein n=1 Tax=Scytonema hofmannii PCC 7110 TaxID=128403 RepID=A0A139XBT8_9CYAN|nr:GUN4 domain-containing protein [Scytonema hofmannii]KYC42149.1 hypothetical protein WA1_19340 [Scytonema hofmannii PCC 7110]